MSGESSIEWTDATWNPTRGCSVVSPGCHNCYAMKVAHRFSGEGMPYHGLTKMTRSGPQWTGDVRLVDGALSWPLRRRKPLRIFVNSMSDLFHEALPFEVIARIFGVMACAPQHTFQVLTKRPERFAAWEAWIADAAEELKAATGEEPPAGVDARASACVCMAGEVPPHGEGVIDSHRWRIGMKATWPLPNVWLGVSVEDQQRADERIPPLLDTPAAVRFLSCEPLLGPLDLKPWLYGREENGIAPGRPAGTCVAWTPPLDLVIVGGESGAGARACNVAWLRSIVRQCADADVACFVKQLGAMPVSSECDAFASMGDTDHGWVANLRDKKGGDPDEWPIDLRVRQLPEAAS